MRGTPLLAAALSFFWVLAAACDDASSPGDADSLKGLDAGLRDVALAADAGDPPDSTDAGPEPMDAGPLSSDAEAPPAPDAGPAAFNPQQWEGSVIYLALTDRFFNGDPNNDGASECFDPASPTLFHGGDFAGMRQRLDYLEELGVDTVWITPVAKQVARRGDSCGYHGYWADLDDPNDGAIDPHLGTDAELTALIDELHRRGMKLVIDLVVNHSGRGARLLATHPEWFHPIPGCEALGPTDVFCSLNGLPDFAHERADVAAYLDGLSADWMRRFAFDGIRMDTVKHVSVDYFREHWVPAVLGIRPALYLLGEIYDEGSYDLQLRYLPAGFHGFFDFPLRRALLQTFTQRGSLNGVADRVREAVTRLGAEKARLRSTFLDNHDVTRFGSEMAATLPANERVERYLLAMGTLFTVPGIPQLTFGAELGMLGAYPENRRDLPGWAFDPTQRGGLRDGYLGDPAETFRFVQRLAALRRQISALAHGGYVELWRPGGGAANLFGFFRSQGESRVIVAINAGDQVVSALRLPFATNSQISAADKAALPDGRALEERLGHWGGAQATLEGGKVVVSLPPRSLGIWTSRP